MSEAKQKLVLRRYASTVDLIRPIRPVHSVQRGYHRVLELHSPEDAPVWALTAGL